MDNKELDELLDKCIEYHGHLCMGQILGVKLAVKGLELANPVSYKDLIVIVENDRCIADAVLTVTGTRLGRRSFKLKDYGRMAATFFNTALQRAYRVYTAFNGKINADNQEEVRSVLYLPDNEVIGWKEIVTHLKNEELPGLPKRVVTCVRCGEKVFDGKDTVLDEGPVCTACYSGSNYSNSY